MNRLEFPSAALLALVVFLAPLSQAASPGVSFPAWTTTQALPGPNVCLTPSTNTTFWSTDPQAALWFTVNGASAGDQATADWYSPDGSLYTSYQFGKVPSAGNFCYSGWIGISGESAAALPGKWTVKLYWNGVLAFTQSFTIATVTLSFGGSMPQIASGGGWDTTLTLLNLGSSSLKASLDFFGNNGSQLSLPFTFPQSPSKPVQQTPVLDETLNPNALLIADTTGPATLASSVGWAQLLTGGAANGFAIFKYVPTGQEAVVPLETRNAGSYVLAFDNTGALGTGVAIANLSTQPAIIPVTIRDDTGATIRTDSISLPAQGHTSFMLADYYPVTAGKRGSVLIDAPQAGRISALGLRVNGTALTTLPVMSYIDTPGGWIAQVASGGGWQTTFTLVNTGASSAQAQLSFFDNNGDPLSLPLTFPQSGNSIVAATVSQTVDAGTTLTLTTADESASAQVGSAQLTAQGNLSGFAIFRYNPTGQEAVVPLNSQTAGAWVLAFDNTNGLSTGLALANESNQPATIPVILRDDTGASLGSSSIDLPAHGHTSFTLTANYPATAGKRGTVEFDAPAGVQISALGLRGTPSGALTTIPAFAKTSNGAASSPVTLDQ